MELVKIENSLPNGFHDAFVESINVDYASKRSLLKLRVFVGDPDAATDQEKELYKNGELELLDFIYFVIEAPDITYRYRNAKELWIDGGEAKPNSNPQNPSPLTPLPDGAFAHWFFIRDWNSFIHVAAMDANFKWCPEDVSTLG